MSFLYRDNKQVRDELKKMLIDKNISMVQVAGKLEILPQQLNNRLNNKRVALSDLQSWLDAAGCDLKITFVDRETGREF